MESNQTKLFNIIASVRAGSGLLSVMLGLVAVFINVAFKKYRFHLQRMILYMSVSSVFHGLAAAMNRVDYFVRNDATETFCVADGFLNAYSSWTVLLSVFAVTCNVFMEIIGHASKSSCIRAFWPVLIFLFPLSFLWIPLLRMEYGQPSKWPWCSFPVHSDSEFGKAIVLTLTIVPYFLFTLVEIVLYLAGVIIVIRRRKLREATNDPAAISDRKRSEKEAICMIMYFALVFLGYFLGFITGVVSQFETNHSVNQWYHFALWIAYASFNPLSAGLTSIIITAEKETCNVRSFLSLFAKKKIVALYPMSHSIEESENVIKNPNAK